MKKNRVLIFILTLIMMTTTVFGAATVPQQIKSIEFHFIDTGNSDSILIMDNGKNMLIDGAENDDEKLIVNYLNNLKIKKLDYVVLTHPDADHVGGLDNVIKNLEIGTVLVGNGSADTKTYKDFLQVAIDKKLKPSVPLESEFTLGEGKFKFYNQKSTAKNVNDRSLVMLYTFGNHKFLFTGDAGVEVEKILPLKEIGDIDVLKVGHHGSKTSSSKSFIDSIKPEYSIICVGKDNKYGHPNKEVLDTLKSTKIYRTDLNGNIIVKSDGKSITISTQKINGKETQQPTVTKFDAAIKTTTTSTTNNNSVVQGSTTQTAVKKVWVTGTGKKYHTKACRYINSTSKELTLEDAKKQGYEACKVCH